MEILEGLGAMSEQEWLQMEQEKEIMLAAMKESLNEHCTRRQVDAGDESLIFQPLLATRSNKCVKLMHKREPLMAQLHRPDAAMMSELEWLQMEQEKEIMLAAMKESLADHCIRRHVDDDTEDHQSESPQPQLADTFSFLVEEQEREMLDMAVRLSLTEQDKKGAASVLILLEESSDQAVGKNQFLAAAAASSSRGGGKIPSTVPYRTATWSPAAVATTPSPSRLNRRSSAGIQGRRHRATQTRGQERTARVGVTTQSKATALSLPQGKEDDFHVMQIVQERARQAALEEEQASLSRRGEPLQPSQLNRRSSTGMQYQGRNTLATGARQPRHSSCMWTRSAIEERSPSPRLPQEKNDDFHVMHVVQERARQAAREVSSSSLEEPPRRSSSITNRKDKRPSVGGVRPGAYSVAPGKGFQRANSLRYGMVGLGSD